MGMGVRVGGRHVCMCMDAKLSATQYVERLGNKLQKPGKAKGIFPRARLPGSGQRGSPKVAPLPLESRQKAENIRKL